jgi:molybdopterin-guanine dinucleotide biosynthesis protein B
MKVVGFAGFSGAGKTTLIEQLIPLLQAQGQRVSVLKHAHHRFDMDQSGKDSWRHRQAGAYEVLLASDQRWALLREYGQTQQPDVHHLLAQFDAGVDWVLVEGFKEAAIPKIEVWRAPDPGQPPRPVRYPHDAHVVAVATTTPQGLPGATALPVLDLNAPAQLAGWLLAQAARFVYPRAGTAAPCTEP